MTSTSIFVQPVLILHN